MHHYNSISVYSVMCLPPKVQLPSLTIYLTPFAHIDPLSPVVTTILLSVSMSLFLLILLIHLLSKFQLYKPCYQLYITVLSTIAAYYQLKLDNINYYQALHQILRTYLFIAENLYPFTNLSLFRELPQPLQPLFYCLYEFDLFFRFHM